MEALKENQEKEYMKEGKQRGSETRRKTDRVPDLQCFPWQKRLILKIRYEIDEDWDWGPHPRQHNAGVYLLTAFLTLLVFGEGGGGGNWTKCLCSHHNNTVLK